MGWLVCTVPILAGTPDAHRAFACPRGIRLAITHLHSADACRALEVRVDSIISNRPLALRDLLFDWRDKCSDQL